MTKKIFLLAAAIAVLGMAAPAGAQEAKTNCIEVRGSHTIKVQPDEITIHFTIDEAATKGRIEIEEVERQAVRALADAGFDTRKELKLISQESSMAKKKKSYSAKQYAIVAHNAEQVSLVFGALDDAGITSIAIVKTTHSRLQELQGDARKTAMLNAQKKAHDLAEAVGQEVGKALYIRDDGGYESGTYTPRLYAKRTTNSMVYEDAAAAGGESVDGGGVIENREIEISYNVFVRFELMK